MGTSNAKGRRLVLGGLAAVGLASAIAACGAVKQRGELMVAMQTDLSLPKDIDHIEIAVTSFGKTLWDQDYSVDPNDPAASKIPATLGVVGDPTNPSAPVEIQVVARNEATGGGQSTSAVHVLRNVTTTVPDGRTALLRMPIEWLCWNQTSSNTQTGAPTSSCPSGQTCVAGSCAANNVNSDDLKPFDPSQVFGGSSTPASGACSNTVACFTQTPSQVTAVTPDPTDCSIPAPATTGAGINVALVRANPTGSGDPGGVGVCTAEECFVPLDQDPTEGWSQNGNKIMLPPAVCRLLATATPPPPANLVVRAVEVSTACATKTPEIPTCGAWDSVGSPAQNGTSGGSSDGGTGCTGTWAATNFDTTACNGQVPTDTITIEPAGNGQYDVTVTAGPFQNSDGSCTSLNAPSVPVTPSSNGTLTLSPPLTNVCACASANVAVTIVPSSDCSTLAVQELFSGLAQCPNGNSAGALDAGQAAAADASIALDGSPGGGTSSGGTSGSSGGGTSGGGTSGGGTSGGGGSGFCDTCGSAQCAPIAQTFARVGGGSSGATGSSGGSSGSTGTSSGGLSELTVQPQNVTLTISSAGPVTQQFNAFSGGTEVAAQWSLDSAGAALGSINGSGLFTTSGQAGSGQVMATTASGNASTTITVVMNCSPVGKTCSTGAECCSGLCPTGTCTGGAADAGMHSPDGG